MAEQTEISWADATFNPWIGCTRVSPGCDHCYAARDNERRKWVAGWGAGVQRRRTSDSNWARVKAWDRKAKSEGRALRVFCASLADVFDNEVEPSWRADLFALIRETPNLRWLLLTKRIGNVIPMCYAMGTGFPENAGIGATMVNQAEWERDAEKLRYTKTYLGAAFAFVSIEPMLGPMDISNGVSWLDWVICGGESGPEARPAQVEWVRSLRDQCAAADVAFHFKQWGGARPKQNGCSVDGLEHKAFPEALAA